MQQLAEIAGLSRTQIIVIPTLLVLAIIILSKTPFFNGINLLKLQKWTQKSFLIMIIVPFLLFTLLAFIVMITADLFDIREWLTEIIATIFFGYMFRLLVYGTGAMFSAWILPIFIFFSTKDKVARLKMWSLTFLVYSAFVSLILVSAVFMGLGVLLG
ncbi:MAG: hypothetical protein FWG64_14650 [Firmicutes bacterium]|nr:hypothetical protein [Bacillota bacterium]